MPTAPLILFPADPVAGEPWRLGRFIDGKPRVDPIAVPVDATPTAVAAAIGRGPITLALPSSACLCAPVRTEGRSVDRSRQALLYQLEAALPLAAEDVAADFIESHPTALGIAVAVDRVRPLLDALDSAGITVTAVCPAALLALDSARPPDGRVAWRHGSAVDLFSLANGQVTAWFTLPAEVDDVRIYLPALAEGPTTLLDVPDPLAELMPGNRRTDDWAIAATNAVRDGRRPRINLARGGLAPQGQAAAARRSLIHTAVAAVACAVVGCGAMLWRAATYQRLADGELDCQRQLFRDLYPGRTVPADVRARLGSEARALASPTTDHPTGSALAVLYNLLARLPTDVRFQLTDVRVADGVVHVEGTVPSRADADTLATTIRDGTGLPVDVPQTNQSGPRVVHFVLNGSTATDRGGT